MGMGARLEIREGETLLERLLEEGAGIGHDCGGKLACSTCRVSIVEGDAGTASEDELDLVERGGGDSASDRLACQVRGPAQLAVEIPAVEVPLLLADVPVTVTAEAARHLARHLGAHSAVRLKVEHSGCSGLRHRLEGAMPGEDDVVFRQHGLDVVVARLDLPFVQGTLIDLEQAGLARKLRFSNPNATSSCGCGESFGTA